MRHPRLSRAHYRHLRSFTTRWRDNDVYGHMNNAVYYEYVDSVVNAWLIETGALAIPDGPVIAIVAETGCTFFESLGFPLVVETGLRAARVGATSVTYEIGLFAPGIELEAARARFVHVCVDRGTRRPVPLPESLRAALAAIAVPA
jgi:acyl-CoA thioester hydrolase